MHNTGNVMAAAVAVKTGIIQQLTSMNLLAIQSHVRRVCTPLDRVGRGSRPRQLLPGGSRPRACLQSASQPLRLPLSRSRREGPPRGYLVPLMGGGIVAVSREGVTHREKVHAFTVCWRISSPTTAGIGATRYQARATPSPTGPSRRRRARRAACCPDRRLASPSTKDGREWRAGQAPKAFAMGGRVTHNPAPGLVRALRACVLATLSMGDDLLAHRWYVFFGWGDRAVHPIPRRNHVDGRQQGTPEPLPSHLASYRVGASERGILPGPGSRWRIH